MDVKWREGDQLLTCVRTASVMSTSSTDFTDSSVILSSLHIVSDGNRECRQSDTSVPRTSLGDCGVKAEKV